MHPIEPHLPALNRYAKSLVKGKPHIDYRDVVNEAVLACLVANPENLDQGYVLSAARSRAFNMFKQPLHYELKEDYSFWVIEPEAEILIYARERKVSLDNVRGKVSINREKRRRNRHNSKDRSKQLHTIRAQKFRENNREKYNAYMKEYNRKRRKNKKNEQEQKAAA